MEDQREGIIVYTRPQTLAEAVSMLAGGRALLISGGTDIYPSHVGRQVTGNVIDVSRVREMKTIAGWDGGYRLGGAVTWSELLAAPLPPAFDALKQAAREVGSKQIQNRGTLAGNLCNASPAADGVPPLLALDAEVELASAQGTRRLALSSFITGYRRTALAADEVLTAILVRNSAVKGRSAFVKLGARRYLVISITMAAANIEVEKDGRIARARVAIGAASPVSLRLTSLEADLRGLAGGKRPSSLLSPRHLDGLSPIGDVRATAEYRLDAAITVIGEALDLACGAPPA